MMCKLMSDLSRDRAWCCSLSGGCRSLEESVCT